MIRLMAEAMSYAGRGYRVFPCKPGEKRPATPNGCLAATADKDRIRAWWLRNPQANIGLATDGLAVIDIDPGAQWPDEARRREIKALAPPLQRTPRGGWHIVFRRPDGVGWRCSAGQLAPHVDVRTTGGYICVTPSETAIGRYRWLRPLVPRDRLPPPPPWLCRELDRLARPAATPEGLDDDGGAISSGQRNSELTRIAGKLRRAGLSETELFAALVAINRQRCTPPLPEPEVARITKSVARYPAAPPKTPPAMRRAWRHAIAYRRNR